VISHFYDCNWTRPIFFCPRFKYKKLKRFLLQYLMNCYLISGQFSTKQFKCFTFESDRKTTTTYDLTRLRGNSCQVSITSLVEFNDGQAISSQATSSKSCSYVPECFTQGKLNTKKIYFSFRFITLLIKSLYIFWETNIFLL